MNKSVKEVDTNLRMIFDHMPGAWGCKDDKSKFMYANQNYADLVGVRHHEDIIGMTDFDMPCKTVECAGMFREQDNLVINTNEKMRILDIHPFADGEWKIYVFTKIPLLDKNKSIIGTIFQGQDITNSATIEISHFLSQQGMPFSEKDSKFLSQNSYVIGSNYKKVKLTPKLSECLFYLLRGKTAKKIAEFQNTSPRTIEEHIEKLRNKFGCKDKSELIDKAIGLGYMNNIPEGLFNSQTSLALKN